MLIEKEDMQAPLEIKVLAEKRKIAKEEKNWVEADRLRDEIYQSGWVVRDTEDGFELSQS